jgi:hypothetical protein
VSAARTPDAACPACGESVPDGARFCPGCGRPVEPPAPDEEKPEPAAVDETGRLPVAVSAAEPRLFGLAPPVLSLGLAAVSLGTSIALFATGRWPLGLILLGAAVLLLVLFGEVARRKPDTALTRASAGALRRARGRAAATVEQAAARGRAGRDSLVLRRRLGVLAGRRRELLTAFGDAVYRGDQPAADRLRAEIGALDTSGAEIHAELARLAEATNHRIASARLSVQDTQLLKTPQPPDAAPPEP